MVFHNPLSPPPRGGARRKAMDQFAVSRQSSSTIQHEIALERAATDANTAKLRAMRLMRETNEREAARIAAENAPPPKPKKPRKKVIHG